MTETIARHLLISGRVQGVSYRAWARDKARTLGLSGWVRNLGSGEVEAIVSGPVADVEAFIAACRTGPAGAKVERIKVLGSPEARDGMFVIRDDG